MQSVSSRIWTRVTVSISYDGNHYTTGISEIGSFILSEKLQLYFMYIYAQANIIFAYMKKCCTLFFSKLTQLKEIENKNW